jgi:hypothetical protein
MKLHQKAIVIFFTFLWCCPASAQVITGVVCDKDSKQPVSDVYVNLGETIYAVTNISGKFEVKTNSVNNAKMTLYHVAYHTVIIDNPFYRLPDTLYIEEKKNAIPEVTITARKNKKSGKIGKKVAVVEFVIEKDNSISNLKLIRSSGVPSFDALALQHPIYVHGRPRGKPIREKHILR